MGNRNSIGLVRMAYKKVFVLDNLETDLTGLFVPHCKS